MLEFSQEARRNKRKPNLDVVVRVPVGVVDDDSVSTRKVDAQASGSG